MSKEWYTTHQKQNLADYFTLLKFPSISTDPNYGKDVRACADWLYKQLTQMGLHVEIWGEETTAPTLFVEDLRAGPHKETLLLYSHYDVQPQDPLEQWHSPPFDPQIRGNTVYARGASDNKGQLFYTLLAIKCRLELQGSFPFNLKWIIEGEEESGSSLLTHLLEEKKERLRADHLLVIDSGFEELEAPAIAIGARGLTCLSLSLKEADFDLHSGQMGGIAYNPNRALVQLLATLYDDSGKVAIKGFYDDCIVLDKATKAAISFTFDKEGFKKKFGFTPLSNNPLHAAWLEPTLEINGISGGYAGPGFKTVIPSQAFAKISCRVAAGQNPEKIRKLVKEHLLKYAPAHMKLTIEDRAENAAALLSLPHAKIVRVMKEAYEKVFNRPVGTILMGGSIPIAKALSEAAGAEVALVGVALNTDLIHAPNEHFGLDRLELGFLTLINSFDLLG